MKSTISHAAAVALLAGLSASSPVDLESRATPNLPGLPSSCMTSYNGIKWGWLPDDVNGGTMAKLQADSGKKGCFFGDYTKINDANYDGSDITYSAKLNDAKTSGAVMVPSAMPVGVKWNQIDSNLAGRIGNMVKAFTNQGNTVYLRFAHEMNCYGKPGCASPAYPGYQDYAGFKQAWINVANVCRGIQGCYMYWCPNLQDLSTMSNWWPGADYVDIVGVDHYPGSDLVGSSFSDNYGAFYNQFVKAYNKPFLLGETASTADLSTKDNWVHTLSMSDFSSFPLYKGAMWFEYYKDNANFEIVLNQSKDQINKVVANFA